MPTSTETKLMNVYDLSQTVEFRHLSPKMAAFVLAYIQNYIDSGKFDPVDAVEKSYDCKSKENARTLGYQLLENPKIILCLAKFFGESPEESFLKAVQKAIYNRRLSVAQQKTLQLYSDLHGWSKFERKNSESETGGAQCFPIGAIVEQAGKRYRIEAVEIPNEF